MSIGYLRASSTPEAAALVAAGGWILAGGQSLMPRIHLGEVDDIDLVDINRLTGLDEIVLSDQWIEIGALVRLEAARRHPLVIAHLPMLAAALEWVANPAVRLRGTLVGNLVQFGPGAEAVAACEAAEARLMTADGAGFALGRLPAGSFATGVRLRASPAGTRGAFLEVQRRFGHLGLVGCGIEKRADGRFSVCFSELCDTPLLATTLAERLSAGERHRDAIEPAIEADLAGRTIRTDLHADAAYRRAVAPVLVDRVLARLEAAP